MFVAKFWAKLRLDSKQYVENLQMAGLKTARVTAKISKAVGKKLPKATQSATTATKEMAKEMSSHWKDVSRIVQGILVSQFFYRTTNAIQEVTMAVYNMAEGFEVASISFEMLLGSQKRATTFLHVLEDFAAVTPFTMESARNAAQKLIAMGFQAESIIPVLTSLLDATTLAGGDEQVLDRLTKALGKIKTTGRVAQRELLQFAYAGIPVYDILKEELHLTAEEMKSIGNLKIPADTAINAIITGMDKRYAGAAEAISKTSRGLRSTIKDNFMLISKALGQNVYDKVHGTLEKLAAKLQYVRDSMRVGGEQGFYQALFGDFMGNKMLALKNNIVALGGVFKKLWKTLKPILGATIHLVATLLNLFLPVINLVLHSLTAVTEWLTRCSGAVRFFVWALFSIISAGLVITAITTISSSLVKATLAAKLATFAITKLGKVILYLTSCIRTAALATYTSGWMALLAGVAALLLLIAMNSKKVQEWMVKLSNSLNKFFGLGGNANYSEQFEDSEDAAAAFNQQLEDSAEYMRKFGEETSKAANTLMPFDEIYGIKDATSSLEDFGEEYLDALENGVLPTFNQDVVVDTEEIFDDNLGNEAEDYLEDNVVGPLEKARRAVGFVIKSMAELVMGTISTCGKFGIWLGQTIKHMLSFPGLVTDILFTTALGIVNWVANTAKSFLSWSVETLGIFLGWFNDTVLGFGKWAISTGWSILGWAANTALGIAKWSLDTMGSFTLWFVKSGLGFGKWLLDTLKVFLDFKSWSKEHFSEWWTDTKTRFSTWWTDTKEGFVLWKDNTFSTLNQWFSDTFSGVSTWFTDTKTKLSTWWSDTKTGFSTWATDSYQSVVQWKDDTISGIFIWYNETKAKFKTWREENSEYWATWWEDTKTGFTDWAEDVYNGVMGWWTSLKDGIHEIWETITGWYDNLLGDGPVSVIPMAPTTNIPGNVQMHADGGIFSRAHFASISEGNKTEAILPVDNPSAMANVRRAIFGGEPAELFSSILQSMNNNQPSNNAPQVYVWNLIGDERSLRELSQKLNVIRMNEAARGVTYEV